MSRTPIKLSISDDVRVQLEKLVKAHTTPLRVAQRAVLVLQCAEGVPLTAIAEKVGVTQVTARKWRRRFESEGISSLFEMRPGRGRKATVSAEKVEEIVQATLHSKPANATHWSCRTMAQAQGVSKNTIQRIWDAHGLQPHRVKSFKLSRDKRFVEKLTDVVGLYLSPPDKAVVLCVDEKSQVQALDRTQPGLPMKRGRCGTMTHDYKRNGTTTLFAALNMLDGTVIGQCLPRHRNDEFLKFLRKLDREFPKELDLHLIVDNYGTHTHPNVKEWLQKHPRFILHFTPTSSSWLNMIERWFREITEKRIRRGAFQSVQELIEAIEQFIKIYNGTAKPFVWTATVDAIMTKINKCKLIYGTLH
jgi:transposase